MLPLGPYTIHINILMRQLKTATKKVFNFAYWFHTSKQTCFCRGQLFVSGFPCNIYPCTYLLKPVKTKQNNEKEIAVDLVPYISSQRTKVWDPFKKSSMNIYERFQMVLLHEKYSQKNIVWQTCRDRFNIKSLYCSWKHTCISIPQYFGMQCLI